MKKNVLVLTVLLATILGQIAPFSIQLAALGAGDISAQSASLYCKETGDFLFEKDSTRRMPMASTTKIATAITVIQNMPLETKITIPKEACGIEGSSAYLTEGEILTTKDLLYALMLQSANDAATALAIACGGSVENFALMMNEMAKHLGLQDTSFTNPHGLDDPNHYTTAKDLAKITSFALDNHEFASIVSCKTAKIPGPSNSFRVFSNHNKLLRLYDNAIGVKTGFTKKSGRCLVGASMRDGITLISVTLHAPNDWNDHTKMFDFGFSMLENRLLAKANELEFSFPLTCGTSETVRATNADDVYAVLNKNSASPEVHVEYTRPLTAPIRKGDVIGTLYFTIDGRVIGSSSLLSKTSISQKERLKRKWLLK